MPDVLAQALAVPGLGWLIAAALIAGLVRGFSGFGTAMVFLPVAGQVLPPVSAITAMIMMDIVGPLPNVPRALRDGEPGDVLRLSAGALIALPVGLALLLAIPPEVFRYTVSVLALLLVVMLIGGFRYHGRRSPSLVFGTGALAGFLGGVSGVIGPPVILFYMAGSAAASRVRANTLLFLLITDIAMLGYFALAGRLAAGAVAIGVALIVPYTLANIAGAAIFSQSHERIYRAAAYAIIAASAIMGLPLLD